MKCAAPPISQIPPGWIVVIALIAASGSVHAAGDIWSATPVGADWIPAPGQANWGLGINAFPGSVALMTNADIGTFAATSTKSAISINSPMLNIGGIIFGNAIAADSDYSIGTNGGNPLFLSNGGTVKNNSLTPATGKIVTYTVAAPLVIQNSGGTATGGGVMTLDFSGGSTSSSQNSFMKITGAISGAASAGNNTVVTLTGNNNIRSLGTAVINSLDGVISNGANGGTLSLALTTPAGNASTTILLTGANTYTGGTTLARGSGAFGGSVLRLANNAALGTGPVTFLSSTGSSTIQQASGSTLALANALNLANTGFNSRIDTNGGAMALDGVISGAGVLEKTGTGTLTLGNAANIYSSATVISGGALGVSIMGNTGSVTSNLGQNSTVHIGSGGTGATLVYTGAGETSNRTINLSGTSGGATLQNDGAGAITFSANFTATGLGNKTLVLQGTNTGENTLGGIVSDSTGFATSVSKTQAGTWLLASANTYSGTTAVTGGTLVGTSAVRSFGTNPVGVSIGGSGTLSLRSDSSVSFTNGTSAYDFKTSASGATLNVNQKTAAGIGQTITIGHLGTSSTAGTATTNFTGANNTSLAAGAVTGAAASGGTDVLANSISAGGTLTLASYTSARTGNHTLTFSGTGSTIVSGTISQNGGNTLSLTKSGTGSLMLNASNTFTGTTTISGGVLRLGNAAALNTGSVSISGGTLDLNGFTPSNHLISISGTLANNGAEVDLGSVNPGTSVLNGLPNGGNPLTVTGSGDITLGTVTGTSGLSLTKNGSNNLTMAGNSDNAFMSMTVNSGTLILNKSTTGHVANEITIDGGVVRYGANTVSLLNGTGQINTTTVHSGILDLNGASGDNATIGNLTGSGGIITNSSGAPAILTIGGNNGTGGNYQGVIEDRSGQLALTKIGTGTITLSGVNTYTGDTTVTEGVLILKSACLSDRSFVSVVSGASLDLDFTGSDIVTGLTLGGVAQANGVYDASNSGGHLTGTGRIQVGANLNFATWAAANGIIGQSAMGDFDHDGLSNIMEYALGLDPASASTTPGILSGGVLVFTKGPEAVSNGDVVWQIERSTTLTDWEVVTPDADNPVTISYSLPIGQSKRFARLRITRIP